MDRITAVELYARVVETGSFSRAARDLKVTQPTVTKHVAALERRLKAKLLNRNTRGVSVTETGAAYYERCKVILREFEAAESLVHLAQTGVGGWLRISTSIAFGRRVVTPLLLEFMAQHPQIQVDLSCDDRYVDLVAQGVDVALRMGRLADSSLGERQLGTNPWVMVAAQGYLKRRGMPRLPADLARHECLVYSSVQGDAVWHLTGPSGQRESIVISGRMRSNSLSTVLAATRAEMGVAILPWYVAHDSVDAGDVRPILADFQLPAQEIHAVFPSPRLLPGKVSALLGFLKGRFSGEWWREIG